MANYEYTRGKEVDLKAEQQRTFDTPRMHYGPILKMMFLAFDLFYGKKRTLHKVKVLEVLARYPYWAWENGGYHMMTRFYASAKPTQRDQTRIAQDHIELGRDAQDNEQWHLMLIEDIINQKGLDPGWLKGYLLPRLMTMGYYYLTRLMYAINPGWSFAMNAAFEDHAENQYMLMAEENPAWDDEPVESVFFEYYPKQKSLADLLRRIALDERDHKFQSLKALEQWRSAVAQNIV